jgi:hypothetical protein
MTARQIERMIRRALVYKGDVNAGRRAVRTGSMEPIARRAARRVYGKATGRIARWIFG